MDTLQRLRADIEAKRKELAELEIAEAVLARYEQPVETPRVRVVVNPALTLTNRIMSATARILKERQPLHTSDLLVLVTEAIGQEITQEHLSTTLSRNKEEFGLVNNRRYGWSFKAEGGGGDGVASTETTPDSQTPSALD